MSALNDQAKKLSERVARELVMAPGALLIPAPVKSLIADLVRFQIVLADRLYELETKHLTIAAAHGARLHAIERNLSWRKS